MSIVRSSTSCYTKKGIEGGLSHTAAPRTYFLELPQLYKPKCCEMVWLTSALRSPNSQAYMASSSCLTPFLVSVERSATARTKERERDSQRDEGEAAETELTRLNIMNDLSIIR